MQMNIAEELSETIAFKINTIKDYPAAGRETEKKLLDGDGVVGNIWENVQYIRRINESLERSRDALTHLVG